MIAEETHKLGGLGDSAVTYDYNSLQPFPGHPNPFWVTFCQEEVVFRQLEALPLGSRQLIQVTTPANALLTACRYLQPEIENALLVDLGASGTQVAVLRNGQGVYASHFPLGGDRFTDVLCRDQRLSLADAEHRKQSTNLFSGRNQSASMIALVDQWYDEIERLLADSSREQSPQDLGLVQVLLSGGASFQPGLIEHLNGLGAFSFARWSGMPGDSAEWPAEKTGRFAVALGTALRVWDRPTRRASLLPKRWRDAARKERLFDHLKAASIGLLILLLLVLGWAARITLERRAEVRDALRARGLEEKLNQQYLSIHPILERRQNTLDVLRILADMRTSAEPDHFFFVMLTDTETYRQHLRSAKPASEEEPPPSPPRNPGALPAGFVTELCILDQGDAQRETLSRIASKLSRNPRLKKVDALAESQWSSIVDTNVVIPAGHFALILELTDSPVPSPTLPPPSKSANGLGPSADQMNAERRPLRHSSP